METSSTGSSQQTQSSVSDDTSQIQSKANNAQTQSMDDSTQTLPTDDQTTKAVLPTTDNTLASANLFTIRAKIQEKSSKLTSTRNSNFSVIPSTVVPGNKIKNKIITHIVNGDGLVDAELALQNHYNLLSTLDTTYTATILDTISSITSPNVVIGGGSDDSSAGDGSLPVSDGKVTDPTTPQTQSSSVSGDTITDDTTSDVGG